MPKPVCCRCNLFYRPAKNGIYVIEGKPVIVRISAVDESKVTKEWRPYKLWQADRWQCQGCGHELVTGFGKEPFSEDWQPGFQTFVEILKPERQINDC